MPKHSASAKFRLTRKISAAKLHLKLKQEMNVIDLRTAKKHLGFFDTPEEGYQAYLKAKRALHAGNTL